jgi:hypothetical protein
MSALPRLGNDHHHQAGNFFTKNGIRAISFSLAESDLCCLAQREDEDGRIDFEGCVANNRVREFRRRPIFFTPIGRNPLKSYDSEK